MRQLHAFMIRAGRLFAGIALLAACATLRADDVVQARAALAADYAQRLEALAAQCAERSLAEPAKTVRAWLPKRDADKFYIFDLPATFELSAAGKPTAASDGFDWATSFRKLREAQGANLWELARRALAEHRPSLAYELAVETVRENPEHAAGRKFLGFVKYQGAWRTPYEVRQLGAGKVWDDRFGWLSEGHLERYEKGERLFRGRWISAEEDARLHSDIRRGWRVESEHYVVTTNHSLEDGVRLAERLEKLYRVWQQVFISYLVDETEMARRFDGQVPRTRDIKPHQVVYYRTRDEYNSALRSAQPQIDITLGIYFDNSRTAYFFAGKDQSSGTLFHEATHQLFQETRPVAKDVGRKENFWIIEAVACYMESLDEKQGYATVGGLNAGRMPAARQRLLVDQFYVPLAELVTFGMSQLQHDARIAKLYSESSGLATFLMHADAGRYREPLMKYLEAVYTSRADAKTLATLIGTAYDELDRRYRAFMGTTEEK